MCGGQREIQWELWWWTRVSLLIKEKSWAEGKDHQPPRRFKEVSWGVGLTSSPCWPLHSHLQDTTPTWVLSCFSGCFLPFSLPIDHACRLSHVQLFSIPWTVVHARFLFPWDCPGKNTGEGCHFLLQDIFPGIEPTSLCLLHHRQILFHWATWEPFLWIPPFQPSFLQSRERQDFDLEPLLYIYTLVIPSLYFFNLYLCIYF